MQLKMGGKFHLKLNIGERPIANKYREGKMKSTLKRELNSTWNCWKGNAWSQSRRRDSALLLLGALSGLTGQHRFRAADKGEGKVAASGCVIAPRRKRRPGPRNPAQCLGCWRNGFKRPVLKHGPRSLHALRVFGWKTRDAQWKWRGRYPFTGAPAPEPDVFGRPCGRASCCDPKDGELFLRRAKPEETLVEARSGSDVQIDRQNLGIGAKD